MHMQKIILPIGAFIAAGTVTPVIAEAKPGSERPVVVTAEPAATPATRRVAYGDLNLATQIGESALARRVSSAVKEVCRQELGPSPLYYAQTSCRMVTWSDTKPQVAQAIARARGMAAVGAPGFVAAAIVVKAAE